MESGEQADYVSRGIPAPGSRWEWADIVYHVSEAVIPPDPAQFVQLVMVPAPPLLDPGWPEVRKVQALANAHTSAIINLMAEKCWVFYHGVEGSAHYKLLVASAEALIANDIPPAAWACWSVQLWRQFGNKFQMPVVWAWSAKRVTSSVNWFRSEYGGGSRMILPPKAKELRRRWQEMRWQATRLSALATSATEMELLMMRVVQDQFEGRYNELLAQACEEAAQEQASVLARVRQGDWLWS